VLVIEPSSEFFKYLKSTGKGQVMWLPPADGVRAHAGARGPAAFSCAEGLADTFRRITELADGQIRFLGLSSIVVGIVLLFILK
jgi:hypothetical protein